MNNHTVVASYLFTLKSDRPCGYVEVAPNHPWYGLHYDDVHRLFELEEGIELTYSTCKGGKCVFGFDTMHLYDDEIIKESYAGDGLAYAEHLLTNLAKSATYCKRVPWSRLDFQLTKLVRRVTRHKRP